MATPARKMFAAVQMGWLAPFIIGSIVTASLGAALVVLVIPLNCLTFFAWVTCLMLVPRKYARAERRGLAAAVVLYQAALMGVLVIAAVMAPGKRTERFLDRTIELPSTEMTLADLEGERNGPRPDWRPSCVGIMAPEDEWDTRIVFPAAKISLREFVQCVEGQSTLRHHFSHCGNGYTILGGGDCSFGLWLGRPN